MGTTVVLAYFGPALIAGLPDARRMMNPGAESMELSLQGALSGYIFFFQPLAGLIIVGLATLLSTLAFFIFGRFVSKGRDWMPITLLIAGLLGALLSVQAGLAFLRVGEPLLAFTWVMTIVGLMCAVLGFAKFADPVASEKLSKTDRLGKESEVQDWAVATARRIADKKD